MKQFFFVLTLLLSVVFAAQTAQASIPAFSGTTITISGTIGEPSAKKTTAPKQTLLAKATKWLKKVAADNSKTVAILSYITLIGWLVAFLGMKPFGELGGFHLRNALGIMATNAAVGIVFFILSFIPYIGLVFTLLSILFSIFTFINWLMGLINAAGGKQKGALLFGDLYQKWFAGIK